MHFLFLNDPKSLHFYVYRHVTKTTGHHGIEEGRKDFHLCFHFQLFLKGGWQLQKVVPEKIRVQRNLSYAEADELIAKREGFWETLLLCCEALLKSRLEEGALNLPRREFKINVSDPKRVLINPLDRNSPANRIIEELAVLVNRETGRLFHEASFPGIYRGQAPYELVKELKSDEEMTQMYTLRSRADRQISKRRGIQITAC